MRRRKHSFILGIMLLVLALGIGYAYINTTLSINGTTDVDANTWNVYWDNVQVTTGSVSASTPTIDTNQTTVSFSVHLSKPGDFYEFTVDAKNDGSIDAMIEEINQTVNGGSTSSLPNYVRYTITYADGLSISNNQVIHPNAIETYKIRVEYRNDIEPSSLPSTATTLNLGFGINYIQSDSNAVEVLHPNSFATDDWSTIQNAIREGATSAYHVGDTKDITMSGSFGTQTIRIANLSTPAECAGENFSQTACGFVLEFADIVTNRQMNSIKTNAGGWRDASIRTYVNNTMYNALPSDLKSIVIDTKVISNYDPTNDNDFFVTTDKLYLLDVVEICPYNKYYHDKNYTLSYDKTRRLDYYAISVWTASYKRRRGESSSQLWWSRSAASGGVEYELMNSEEYANSLEVPIQYANYSYGISPAFRIG